jgi:hypothetical protein
MGPVVRVFSQPAQSFCIDHNLIQQDGFRYLPFTSCSPNIFILIIVKLLCKPFLLIFHVLIACLVNKLLWAGQPTDRSSILGRGKRYFSPLKLPDCLWSLLWSKTACAWSWPLSSIRLRCIHIDKIWIFRGLNSTGKISNLYNIWCIYKYNDLITK